MRLLEIVVLQEIFHKNSIKKIVLIENHTHDHKGKKRAELTMLYSET